MRRGPLREVIRTERRLVAVKRTYRKCFVLSCGHAVSAGNGNGGHGATPKRSRCSDCVGVRRKGAV